MSGDDPVDLAIIGGGINGAGIARDAAGRGLTVLLCERRDLGWATSSASTKLIHGGLRYLEYYEFRLVREALREREVLMRAAPHIIWPMRFVLPHNKGRRPAWLVRLGLLLYDHIGGRRRLPGTESVDLRRHPVGDPLEPGYTRGFIYSDCWVQDSRLVVLNAMDARARGADILTHTDCVAARRDGDRWVITLADRQGGRRTVTARALVNAAGPWAGQVLHQRVGADRAPSLRLVKGSHIVVPKLYDHDHAYIFQNRDGRIVFAIPYEQHYTLIGTTDQDIDGTLDRVEISPAETAYLCAAANDYFRTKLTAADLRWSYAGVRPLYDDARASASAVTRDYVLDLDRPAVGAPALLTVFGGKLTTYRRLAEQAMQKLAPVLGCTAAGWTATAPLPGGDMPQADFDRYLATLRAAHPWLAPGLAWRLARNYGTRADRILDGATGPADLGTDFGGTVTEAELRYLVAEEWVTSADDVLWRRSRLGLHVPDGTAARIDAWLAAPTARPARRAVAG